MKNAYAVIFSSERNDNDLSGYEETAYHMVELAKTQKGFLDIESVRDNNGIGITISYWETLEDIQNWKKNEEHLVAQQRGKSDWYKSFKVKICKIEREYEF
ncbi:MAG: JEMB protein [Bdellovibrionales bacterium RIFCSPHIGHO2_01_FULL_40_29]|nr:MAG: JEMB protein [Bdellovibrionales bacterium RIFCSPHIGHO2_01_FULL_40_29]OFZ34263.1 MAG: JEMB protein [Bdellovibrionales bacterium RIFCSPHIGHO2_02_FULL_40_15]